MIAPPEAWPEFGNISAPNIGDAYELDMGNPVGIRWTHWPVCAEEYVGDTEPSTFAAQGLFSRNRIMRWKRIIRTDIPPGWHQMHKPWRVDAVWHLPQGGDTNTWKQDARRNVRTWRSVLAQGDFSIHKVSLDDFREAYRSSTVFEKINDLKFHILERRASHPHTDRITLYIVIKDKSEQAIAGTAMHLLPKRSVSVRECSWMAPGTTHTLAPTGLMDLWFAEAQKRNINILISPYLWSPGDKTSWKGLSDFKLRFNPTRVEYPPLLWRFVPGKLF
jgi:hypothetical protein